MVLSLDRWVNKVAVVTGASVGIGAAIAERLVEEGLLVVGLARRSEQVEALSKKLSTKKGKLFAFKADVSKEIDILKAFEWTTKNVGPVSILINNAGAWRRTNLTEGETEKWKACFDLNVLGLSIATREAIKIMRKNNIDGHIVHINSVFGHTVIPAQGVNVYSASKFAVTALTETLRQELNQIGSKIRVTSISPARVDTGLDDPNRDPLDETRRELLKNMPALKPEDIADSVVYVLSTPPHVQVFSTAAYRYCGKHHQKQ